MLLIGREPRADEYPGEGSCKADWLVYRKLRWCWLASCTQISRGGAVAVLRLVLFTFCQRPTHRRRQLQMDKSSVSCSHLSVKRLGPGGTQIEQWHICVKFWARFILKLRRSRPTPGRARPRPTRRSRLEGFESDALDRSQLHQSALYIGLFLSLSVHPCPALVHHRLYPRSKSL
jgi:hypothetical protein